MGAVGSKGVRAVVAATLAVAWVVGCSASGSDDVVDDTTPTEPAKPPSTLPPTSSAPAEVDASKPPPKDAGKDSTVDAGPPPPVPGTPCPVRDEIKKKKCGVCGEQATACLGTGDAGGGTWAEYGACENELAGGCLPGSTVTEACGNCGTRTKTCSQDCAYAAGSCMGEPVDSCVPGAVDLSTASCPAPDVYRQRTCGSACTYDNFTAACTAAPTTITVGPTVGNVTSTIVTLTSTQTAPRLGGTCPAATLTAATTVTPFAYVKVHNPLTKSVLVSVYDSVAPGGKVFATILASYGAATPSTDVQRKACVKGVNDFGDDLLTGDSDFASLSDSDAVTIPAGGTITVYNAAYSKYSAANPTASTGKVRLNVRVEHIN
jgi:hypothetical protein